MNGGDAGKDISVTPDCGSSTRTPRWVKVSGVIVILLFLLVIIVHLIRGGFGSHTHTAPSSPTEHVQRP